MKRATKFAMPLPLIAIILWFPICPARAVHPQRGVMVPMPDGVRLAAKLTLPEGEGPFPTIIVRTPYGKDNDEDDWGKHWAENGYAFLIQDCRGTGYSEGEWYPFKHERHDGVATRNWVVRQTWSNGKVASAGGSYLGYTQYYAALDATESLRAIFAVVPAMDGYQGGAFLDGTLSIGTAVGWSLGMAAPGADEDIPIDEENWDEDHVFRTLPLTEFDRHVGKPVHWLREMIAHPSDDEFWRPMRIDNLKRGCTTPAITISGWYDIFIDQALDYHADAIRQGKKDQHLIIGPWAHGVGETTGERKYGDNHEVDLEDLQEKWFAHWLKAAPRDFDLAPIRLYIMGANIWRDEFEWPLKRTRYVDYYLSGGHTDSTPGSGQLTLTRPTERTLNRFTYDPNDPVPTHGGALLFGEPGALDQRVVQAREDVVVYRSDVLKEALEVTGPIKVILYAATDGRDTDWTAKLVDVYPDGRTFNLCDGVARARYRKGLASPELIQPDQVHEYQIDLWSTSNVFLPGHRIGLEISSSNFPRFDRNPNTGHAFGADAEIRKAHQEIFHGAACPSRVVLPVIPNSE